ncbi:MAG: S8 family serine peptidase [Magnetococcales bacterium]|nr:S8 family serine peptidase [Magnetococcales bacterium]
MDFAREKAKQLANSAGDILSQRRMALTPRDLMPFSFSRTTKRRSKKKSATKEQLRKILAKAETMAISRIKHGKAPMQILLDNSTVKKALGKMAPDSKEKGSKDWQPQLFWTSRSMPMRISKSDLKKLPDEVENIKSIYPNRPLSIPNLVETKAMEAENSDILSATWGLEKIKAMAAWGAHGAYGEGVTIGLLDTGVDASHPDLKGKIAHWAEFTKSGRQVAGSTPFDSDRHGTHCAGTLVGGRESGRHIGVAPKAKIAAGLVLNGKYGGSDAQVLAGIDWAVERGVDVLSMSLGGLVIDSNTPPTYTDAIYSCLEAGIPVVAAIGNEGHQTTGLPGNDPFAYSVGATDPGDKIAGFSGGRTQIIQQSDFFYPDQLPLTYSKPDLSAPGVGIRSSVPGGGWEIFSGTSMATPLVAGAIALLLSATTIRGKLENSEKAFEIQNLLSSSVMELGESGQDHRYGFGRLDVLRAIDFAHDLGYK